MGFFRTFAWTVTAIGGFVVGLQAVPFEKSGWAIRGEFPAEPKQDEFRGASPFGDVVSERYYLEQGGEAFLLLRSVHPIAFTYEARDQLYAQAKKDSLEARDGNVTADQPIMYGDYTGRRIVIEHRRARRTKEMRMVLIGSTLYACTYERPAGTAVSAKAKLFLDGLALQPAFANSRVVEETERWREVGGPRFRVKYDATRWYRDPTDSEPGVYNLLRLDARAEAQLIAERDQPNKEGLVEAVLAVARETAESVVVRRQGKKYRSGVSMEEAEFVVRVGGETYINRGYFYSGAEGTVQFRAWATDDEYKDVGGDIEELLDGLTVVR